MPRLRTVLLAAGLLVSAACSQTQPSQTAQPSSTQPTQVPAHPSKPPTPAPSPAATHAPTASPSPVVTAAPVAIPRLAPNAAPHILSVSVDKTTVGPGDQVSGTVLTSSNVASVEVRVGGFGVSLDKVGVGRFSLRYTLGDLPFFVHGNFEMRIIARNARGDSTEQALPITVR